MPQLTATAGVVGNAGSSVVILSVAKDLKCWLTNQLEMASLTT